MFKVKFEIVEGLDGYVIYDGVDTFTLEQAQQLLKECSKHPYKHSIVEETA